MYNLFQNIIRSGKRWQVKTACRTKILSLKQYVWLHSGSLIHTDISVY